MIVDNFAPAATVTAPAKVDHVAGGSVFTTGGEVSLYAPPNTWPVDQIVRIDSVALGAGVPFLNGRRPIAGWRVQRRRPDARRPATLSLAMPQLPVFPPLGRPVIHRVESRTGTPRWSPSAARSPTTNARDDDDRSARHVPAARGTPVPGATFPGARGLDCQPRVLSPRAAAST